MRFYCLLYQLYFLIHSEQFTLAEQMAKQMNYGPSQNSGRRSRDSMDSSARKRVNGGSGHSSVASAPIKRDLFTPQNQESPRGSVPITPQNHKSPRSAPTPPVPQNWYDAGDLGLPTGWIVRQDKRSFQSPKGTRYRSLKAARESLLDGHKLIEGNLTHHELDFISRVLTVEKDVQG